jgi:NhaA family Na+:H+ antiporter
VKVSRWLVLDQSVPVAVGTVVALFWVAVDPIRYYGVAHALSFVVNDIGMGFFLALIAQESLEAVQPDGALYTWRLWAMPLVVAVGGVAGSAVVYETYVRAAHETVLAGGWPVVCATDVAIAAAVIRRVVGPGAVPFVLLTAIAGDALGTAFVSWHQVLPQTHLLGVVAIVGGIAVSAALTAAHVRKVWTYVILAGSLSWWGFTQTGLNPALALLPIVPFFPRGARGVDLLTVERHERAVPGHFESVFRVPVQAVLFLFALVNAGVLMRGYGTGSLAVLTADLVGRPIGSLTAVAIAVRAGLKLPSDVGWKEMVVVTVALSIGFTFALLFAESVYPVGPTLNQLKIGALATTVAVPLMVIVAWWWRIGAFAIDSKFVRQRGYQRAEVADNAALSRRPAAH